MNTKFKLSKKAFQWALIFGFLCSVFLSFADFDASCEDLRQNILRLHIIANSDSPEDQALKLKIRDRILETSDTLFQSDTDLTSAIETAQRNLPLYEKIANGVIAEENFNYTATAKIDEAFFETRVYEDFTLPGGNYDSLIINIGEGKGKNWWCVIFPGVCVPTDKSTSLSDSVGKKGTHIAENGDNYIVRFKAVEIYEKIKRKFNHS